MNNELKKIIEYILPSQMQLFTRFNYQKVRGFLDPEMFFVNEFLTSRRRFIDIGANVGIYSYYFLPSFKHIEVFEPMQELTYRLASLKNTHISINPVALSSSSGSLNFYIPIEGGQLLSESASLEPQKKPFQKRLVEVKTLDEYGFEEVDLIKIDVEGHEYDVIKGAEKTIKKSLPVMIIEVEKRHLDKPVDEIFSYIANFGYDGYFLNNKILSSIEDFSCEVHQDPFVNDVRDDRYINNFIFIPKDRKLF